MRSPAPTPHATETAPWSAPLAEGPVYAQVPIPGSKSLTNRYLMVAALAEGTSQVRSPLHSEDTELMVGALRALGVHLSSSGPHGQDWLITPPPSGFAGPATVDCGLAGTVMRFLPPVAALAQGTVRLDGTTRARQRPMAAVLGALRDLGVRVQAEGDHLPITIDGTGSVRGGSLTIDASASSQFVSGLLLAAARYEQGLRVTHHGPPVPSTPHITMTIETLRDAGVVITDDEPDTWQVEPGTIGALDVVVEPDLSNAAPFVAAAAVTGGCVHIPGWPQHTTQAGDHLRHIVDAMGVEVHLDRTGLTARGTGELYGIDLDLSDAGELTPTVAALAVLASSPSRLRGIAHLRGHESDRLACLAKEFTALGGRVQATHDGLIITPRSLHGGVFGSYHDHRLATAGAIVGLVVPGVQVNDVSVTKKTMPQFPQLWRQMVAGELPLAAPTSARDAD